MTDTDREPDVDGDQTVDVDDEQTADVDGEQTVDNEETVDDEGTTNGGADADGGPDAESHREVGVEFGELAARLDDHEYPATARELSEAYGEYELQYSGGSETFSATFGSLADTFESADEVRQSVLNGVGQTAVGRKAYTDRGGFASETDHVSF